VRDGVREVTTKSTHLPDQAAFRSALPEDIDWEPFPAFPPGAVIVLPAGTPHFHWAKSSEYVTQVTAIGPISLEYLDPEDDQRNK
jgi:hypothetical protein